MATNPKPVIEFKDASPNHDEPALPQEGKTETPDFSPRFYGITLLLVTLVLSGFLLVQRFTAMDMNRDLQTWQEKLNLVAESRNAEVEQWVGGNFKELRTLAGNPSLQLYMTELQMGEGAKPASKTAGSEPPPQQSYLRNLLVFTADRAGFVQAGTAADKIAANTKKESKSGLAILNKEHEIVVSTLMLDATKDALVAASKTVRAGQEKLLDLQKDNDGTVYIGFTVPVYSIQGEHTPEAQIGTIIGVKEVDENLFGLLKHPGITEKTLEAILVRGDDSGLDYLSPLQDGTSALTKNVHDDSAKDSSEAKLVESIGEFTSDRKDYRNKAVLATSRSVSGTPWTLIVKVDKDEAFAGSNQRRAGIVMIFSLIIVVIASVIYSIWRYMQSHRSMMMSRHFRKLASHAMAQEKLLRLVTDHQPEAIYIVDRNHFCRFANRQAAEEAKMSVDAMAGKALSDVRGTARAEQIEKLCNTAMVENQVEYDLQRFEEENKERVIRSAYVPLAQIPISGLPERTPGVLVVEQNITEIVHEREERLHTQTQLVKTLLNLVDKRDHFSANHSILVSELSRSVAMTMELDNVTIETAGIAGSLMNIGKIVVPTELLTKNARLTEAEKRVVHDSMNMAPDLVADIHFEGPVAETLRQWQEKWDGSGPRQYAGEKILISARIISVSNAYIGMISPRSWRNALAVEAANKFLLDHCDTHFDRRVVIALIHYTETQVGRKWLKSVLESKKVA